MRVIGNKMKKLLTEGMELCIYCLGEYGIRTYFRLRDYGINVSCFGDADEKKTGFVLDDVYCIPYEEFRKKNREKTIIIVCIKYPEKIMRMLREEGFIYVYSCQMLEKELKIRYRKIQCSDETINKINIFREKLYQVTCHNVKLKKGESKEGFNSEIERVLIDAKMRAQKRKETNNECFGS